jgi:hypothetical protein
MEGVARSKKRLPNNGEKRWRRNNGPHRSGARNGRFSGQWHGRGEVGRREWFVRFRISCGTHVGPQGGPIGRLLWKFRTKVLNKPSGREISWKWYGNNIFKSHRGNILLILINNYIVPKAAQVKGHRGYLRFLNKKQNLTILWASLLVSLYRCYVFKWSPNKNNPSEFPFCE